MMLATFVSEIGVKNLEKRRYILQIAILADLFMETVLDTLEIGVRHLGKRCLILLKAMLATWVPESGFRYLGKTY